MFKKSRNSFKSKNTLETTTLDLKEFVPWIFKEFKTVNHLVYSMVIKYLLRKTHH